MDSSNYQFICMIKILILIKFIINQKIFKKKINNNQNELLNLLVKISLKLDSIEERVQELESIQPDYKNIDNLRSQNKPKTHESTNIASSLLKENLVKPNTIEPLPPIFSRNKQSKFMPEIVTEDLKSSHSSEVEIKNNEQSKYTGEKSLNYENPETEIKLQYDSAKDYQDQDQNKNPKITE